MHKILKFKLLKDNKDRIFMKLRLEKYSFRFAEQVMNSKLNLKSEIESIILDPTIVIEKLSRPHFK